ncbi:hypothetical protein ACP4OV_028003 [Aristida adscensionis]
MASARFVLLMLVAVGSLAALPSSCAAAAKQHDDHGGKSAAATNAEKEDYPQNCCGILNARAKVADDCACGILKVIFAGENGGLIKAKAAAACNFTAGVIDERCKKAKEGADDDGHGEHKKLIKRVAMLTGDVDGSIFADPGANIGADVDIDAAVAGDAGIGV